MPSLYRPIVIGFGRFNPPTTGHAQHIEFIRKQAERLHADHRIYASVSQDPRKNPLPFSEKVHFLQQLFPHAKFSTHAGVRTPFDAFSECAAAGYTDLFVVVSGERVPEFQRFAKYFAKPGTPGYREGSSIPMSYTVVDSGRSMNTEHRVSGTQQRRFASDGNYVAFRQHVPTTNDQIAKNLYRSVRIHMGLHEMYNIISGQFAMNLFEAQDTYTVKATEQGKVVWQVQDVHTQHEIDHAVKYARENHPRATVTVENKNGKVVLMFKSDIRDAYVMKATEQGKVVWQAQNVFKDAIGTIAKKVRKDHPKAIITVENKSGKIVLVFKPGQPIHEAAVTEDHILFEAQDTYAVMAIEHDRVVWQMWNVEKSEITLAAKTAREKHPHATVSVENKSGKIVKVFKPGEAIHEDHIKVGDYVHAGFAVKGGAGFSGRVDKIEGNRVYVNVSKDKSVRMKDDPKWGDRIIIAPMKNVTVQEAIYATFGQKMTAASVVYKAITGEHRIPSHLESPEALVNAAILVFANPNKRLTPEGWKIAGQMLQKMDELGVKWNKASLRPLTLRALGLTRIEEAEVSAPKEPTEADRLRTKQQQELITLKQRQANDMMAAKLRDVQQKSREQQQKLNAPKPAAKPAS